METNYYYDFVSMAPIFEYTIYDDDDRKTKVVFENGIQMIDESEIDLHEDIEAASEEELDLFIKEVR